jgi:HK97 family phage major capsid protein
VGRAHSRTSSAFQEAQFRGTRLHYSGGKLIQEQRATIGVEGGPPYGAYPGSTTGLVVPVSFFKEIVSAAKFTTPWYAISDVITTLTGANFQLRADNDIANAAAAVTETSSLSSDITDISLVGTTMSAYKYLAAVKVSNELIQDTGVDLQKYLTARFAARMARGLDSVYLKNSGGPTGVLNGLTASVTASGSSDTDGSGAANTIGLGDLVALEQSLDPTYRANAKFMMHPNTLASLRNVKDSEKRPIFEGLNNPDGPRLLGYPVVLSPAMDQLQASPSSPTVTKTTVAFGDFSYFKIRLCTPGLRMFFEPYILNFETLYVLYFRTDSALVDGASSNRAIVTLQNTY